jgi:hypothetical protein
MSEGANVTGGNQGRQEWSAWVVTVDIIEKTASEQRLEGGMGES